MLINSQLLFNVTNTKQLGLLLLLVIIDASSLSTLAEEEKVDLVCLKFLSSTR